MKEKKYIHKRVPGMKILQKHVFLQCRPRKAQRCIVKIINKGKYHVISKLIYHAVKDIYTGEH
jgi:hypothetical protein